MSESDPSLENDPRVLDTRVEYPLSDPQFAALLGRAALLGTRHAWYGRRRAVNIMIHGRSGSGKSTLAASLGKHLQAPIVSVDNYLEGDLLMRTDHWANYNKERMEREVLRPVRHGAHVITHQVLHWITQTRLKPATLRLGEYIITEGVCMAEPRMRKYADLLVVMDPPAGKAEEKAIERMGEEARSDYVIWNANDDGYTRLYQPLKHADVVYDRSYDLPPPESHRT